MLAVPSFGCGGSHAPPDRAPVERSDKRAALPKGWTRVVNRRAGFNLGIPPGWKARGGPGSTIVRSRDRALAISVTADRGADGRNLKVTSYARRSVRALRGYRDLQVGTISPLVGTRYPAAAVKAEGTFKKTGLRQAIILFVLQKRRAATFTMLFFRSARVPRDRYAAVISAIVRTLRAQAPRAG